MAAYLIIEVAAVRDTEVYARYRETVSPGLTAGGGTYLVRGGAVEVLEGSWNPNRVVVVRFPSADAARTWWSGSGYAELKAMRQRSTTTNMILVEGLE
ncbi:MAG TPA: DUF1330 domain-containing protein [Terriglobia bacterium]|nr:DUF1330 domain-containing protein [Terriglobia bacterium]